MRKFFAFIIRQSVAVVLITLFILGMGVWSTINMSVNLLPDINVPVVCVQTIYAGANASTVEKDVTEKVEDGLSSLSGVTDVTSYSYDNLSAVVLYFDYDSDTGEKKSEIQSKLNSVELPDGVTTTVYDIDLNADALAVLSLTSEKGLEDAHARAKELAAKLSAIDGVENVEIKGGAEYSYLIQPFVGLELISPLLVETFSYGALDLPLGTITENGDVQIKNESDVTCREDIENTPVELPSSIVSLLASVKQVMRYYEDSTQEDLEELRDDLGAGVLTVLNDLGNLSADEIDDLSDLKTYMNIASTYTAQQLKNFKSSRIYNEIFKQVDGKEDEELEDLLEDIKTEYPLFADYITVDMLKVVRDNKLQLIIDFRENYLEQKEDYSEDEYYELSNDDYFVLETQYVKVYSAVYEKVEKGELTQAEADKIIYDNIDFAKQTSATGLANIANKKRDDAAYNPTDAECALLFTGTTLSEEHPIITSPTFMAFVRSENYEQNMQTLIDTRESLHNKNYDEEKDEESPITAEQWNGLYCSLKLNGVFEFKISQQLFGFIIDTDLAELNPNGAKVVTVSEIANITLDPSYESYAYYFDGGVHIGEGIIINIYKSNGANSSKVVQAVKAEYKKLAAEDGYSAEINLLDDQSEFISDSVSNVLVSMVIGGVLAIIIIFLFLKKVRTSLVIAITMPLSVLAALICLYLLGVTLNMVSLGGLAVGIGMLVDNSIVVIEAITKHRDNGKDPFNAAVDGTCEVGGALFGSTVTTVCVFIPIMFAGGLTAEIFTDLALAVIFSLTFSLLVAVTVIPALYTLFGGGKRLLKESAPKQKMPIPVKAEEKSEQPAEEVVKPTFRERIAVLKKPVIMDGCTKVYSKILPKVLSQKLVTILVAMVVFGASIGLLFLTGTEFLPSIDKGQIEVSMSYSGASLEEVQEDVLEFSNRITEEVEGIDFLSASVGKQGMLALTDSGIITVQMKSNKNTQKVVTRIRGLAEEYKPKGSVTVKEIDGVVASLMSGSDDMSVTVIGSDGDTLLKIAGEIGAKLQDAGFTDVKNSAADKSLQYTLNFDRYLLAEKGIDYKTLVMTLRIGIASYTACTVTFGEDSYNITVKFDDSAITSRESLENFVIGSDGNSALLLKDVCTVLEEEKEACMRRSNGNNMISVSAVLPDTDTGTASKKMASVASSVLKNYEGYGFEESGITTYLNDAFSGLAVALVISFFLLYAVMAIQFGSFLKPLIIMASIPFSFTGGFIALVITRTSLNVVSFIGLIMLMGVVVNNAIVMLEKIKQLKDEMPHFEAVKQACSERLRPIFMTTLTTILALIPMAIGVGQGSELMQPLGIVVIGGLLIGTLVTLLLVPAVYCAVYRISAKRSA